MRSSPCARRHFFPFSADAGTDSRDILVYVRSLTFVMPVFFCSLPGTDGLTRTYESSVAETDFFATRPLSVGNPG